VGLPLVLQLELRALAWPELPRFLPDLDGYGRRAARPADDRHALAGKADLEPVAAVMNTEPELLDLRGAGSNLSVSPRASIPVMQRSTMSIVPAIAPRCMPSAVVPLNIGDVAVQRGQQAAPRLCGVLPG